VLITGANTGLGLESAKRLLAAGARVVVTARTQAKVDATVAKLQSAEASGGGGGQVAGAVLDLASLASVPTGLQCTPTCVCELEEIAECFLKNKRNQRISLVH
jgi:NAD(P)-dependent dehydrogenase (short-subunit alcohol dehydrogenase family)